MINPKEILFIRNNAPFGFYSMIAKNLGLSRSTVVNELNRLKDSYDERIVAEARRIVKAVSGAEYQESERETA